MLRFINDKNTLCMHMLANTHTPRSIIGHTYIGIACYLNSSIRPIKTILRHTYMHLPQTHAASTYLNLYIYIIFILQNTYIF